MSLEDNSVVDFLRNLKNKVHEDVSQNQQLSNSSQKELLESLQLDGLIAHSSVRDIVEIYSRFYQENSVMPEQCQIQLFLLGQHQTLMQTNQTYSNNQSIIAKNLKSLEAVKRKTKQIEDEIQRQEKKIAIEKTRVEEFKSQGLKLVLSQNRRLEFELEKQDHELNINDMNQEDLLSEISKYRQSIRQIQSKITGEHDFPMTKSEAVALLAKLDTLLEGSVQ